MTKSSRARGWAGSRYPFLTSKERDIETGLDYFNARYYSSTQGRFTSSDPDNAGAEESDPQSWNGYAYARSSPLVYSDPDGRKYMVCDPNGDNCTTVSDEDFWAERKKLKETGNVYTGSGDFFESGEIRNAEGGVVATYVQISIDDPVREAIYAIRNAVDPIPQATLDFFKLSLELGLPGGVIRYVRRAPSTITTLGIAGGVRRGLTAGQKLRNLHGMSRTQARQELAREGFRHKGNTPGGYEKWYHPDGSKVQIRPNGEVVRVPSNQAIREAGKTGSGWRVNPESGDVVRPHTSTIEKVQ